MCLPLFFRGGALIYQAIETNRTSAEVANGGDSLRVMLRMTLRPHDMLART